MCQGCRSTTVIPPSLCCSMAADQSNSTSIESSRLCACLISASKFLIVAVAIPAQQGVFLSQLLHLISSSFTWAMEEGNVIVSANTPRGKSLSRLSCCVTTQHNVLAALRKLSEGGWFTSLTAVVLIPCKIKSKVLLHACARVSMCRSSCLQ